MSGGTCDGAGTCVETADVDCGLYACNGGACATSCASDVDCAPGARCDGGACVAKTAAGVSCAAAAECATGFRADASAAPRRARRQCEACDVAGAVRVRGRRVSHRLRIDRRMRDRPRL